MKVKSVWFFPTDGMPKEGSHCICLSVILIDSVLEIGKNYYPQVFLEECRIKIKYRIRKYVYWLCVIKAIICSTFGIVCLYYTVSKAC